MPDVPLEQWLVSEQSTSAELGAIGIAWLCMALRGGRHPPDLRQRLFPNLPSHQGGKASGGLTSS